ncbi:MAG: WG repeat-containing protein [Bilifractor sp.]
MGRIITYIVNKILKKIKRYKHVALRCVLIAAIIPVFLFTWHKTLNISLKRTDAVNYAIERFKSEGRYIGNNVFVSSNNDYYLLNSDNYSSDFIVAGPYTWIAADDFYSNTHIVRYRSTNGLIGFVDENGNEITPAIYLKASCFSDECAVVTDQEGNEYRIDTKGRRVK